MENFGAVNLDCNTTETEHDTSVNEFWSPDSSYSELNSELYQTASSFSETMDLSFDEPDIDLEEFDKNLPETVSLLTTQEGAKLYLIGTAHVSKESQNDVSKVIQAVKPHFLVVELCADRASVMQMDEETIKKEAKDFSYAKLKDLFKEVGIFQGIIYVLLLKLSATLTEDHGIAPGGEFRRALKEIAKLKRCYVFYGDRSLRITMKRALSRLSWRQSISMFFSLLFTEANLTTEEIEKYKKEDFVEEMMANLLTDYPELSAVLIKERDIYLTHSMQVAAARPIFLHGNGRIPTRVVGIVGIGHCAGIKKLWGTVKDSEIPPLMIIPEPSKSDIIIKSTLKVGFLCLVVVGVYYIIPIPKSWSSSLKATCSSVISKLSQPIKH